MIFSLVSHFLGENIGQKCPVGKLGRNSDYHVNIEGELPYLIGFLRKIKELARLISLKYKGLRGTPQLSRAVWVVCLMALFEIGAQEEMAGEGAEIKEISQSRKSIILDRGSLEGVRIGQVSKFYLNETQNLRWPKYRYVGEGQAVRVYRKNSFWLIRHLVDPSMLRRGRRLVLFRQALDGKRPLINRHTQKVLRADQEEGDLRFEEEKGIPRERVFRMRAYRPFHELPQEHQLPRREDIQTESRTSWKSIYGGEYDEKYKEEKPIYFAKDRHLPGSVVDFKNEQARKMWGQSIQGSVDKMNDLSQSPEGLVGFYARTLRGPEMELPRKGSISNLYDKKFGSARRENFIDPSAREKIKKEGVRFSASMNDEQLRRFFIERGIEEEVRKQRKALLEKESSEIHLSYHSAINRHTTNEDQNYQNIDYSLSLAYEHYLGNINPSFDRYSLVGELETGLGFYNMGGFNARFAESSFRVSSYWYFLNRPHSLYRFMPYLGLGFRRGSADVYSPEFKGRPAYTYLLVSFPSLRLGVKYRFKAGDTTGENLKVGLGANLQVQYETVFLSSRDVLKDEIFGRLNLGQFRFGFGLSAYF